MNVTFALISGPQIILQCNVNEKIRDILYRIIASFQLQNLGYIYLIYKGIRLNENDEIGVINYTENTIIYVCIDNQGQNIIRNNNCFPNLNLFLEPQYLEVSFSLISGRRITIKCNPNETINDVLWSIKKKLQIDFCNTFKFIYKGKVLDISKKFNDIGYDKGNTIIVNAN